MKIGICDWGIGGLGIYKTIRTNTNWDICYISDAGFTPYGKVSEDTLYNRWQKVESYFKNQDIDTIIVACNALGTVVPKSNNVYNILTTGISYLKQTKCKNIGVTGGYRTIESGLFQEKAKTLGLKLTGSVGQPLSAFIESGDVSSGAFLSSVKQVFNPLINTEEVILACTHYPAISNEINFLYPNIELVDPADRLCNLIQKNIMAKKGNRTSQFLTTGDSQSFIEMGQKSFKVRIAHCNSIQI